MRYARLKGILMEIEVTKKLFTVDEFNRMAEVGIFGPKPRIELIEGEIIEMAPIGMRHMGCVNRATALLITRLGARAVISVQNAVVLSNYTEPQPDIVVAKPRDSYYGDKYIAPEDTFLVIEVSDTTVRYDRDRKMPLYAKAKVPEVWIENLQNDVVLVYRDPDPKGYKTALTLHRGEALTIAAFPEIQFKVEDFLG
jgi:Uma2 family endonuclease